MDFTRAIPHVENKFEIAEAIGTQADIGKIVGIILPTLLECILSLVPFSLKPRTQTAISPEARVVLFIVDPVISKRFRDDACLSVNVVIGILLRRNLHLLNDMSLVLDGLQEIETAHKVSIAVEMTVYTRVVALHPDTEILIGAEETGRQRVTFAHEGAVIGRIESLDTVTGILVFLSGDGQLDHDERQLLGLSATENSILVFRVSVKTELKVSLQILCKILGLVGIVMEESIICVERKDNAIIHLE